MFLRYKNNNWKVSTADSYLPYNERCMDFLPCVNLFLLKYLNAQVKMRKKIFSREVCRKGSIK